MSSYNHFGCSCCGGPFNGGNCPGCSSVGSGDESVYDSNPYSYNDTPNFFNQPPQHQYETYSCEFCGGNPHPGFDCQTGNTLVFDQEVHIIVMIAKQGTCPSMIRVLVTIRTIVMTNIHSILRISNNSSTVVRSVEVPIRALIVKPGTSLENNRILEEMLRTQMLNSPVVLNEPEGSDDYTEVTYDKEQCLSDHYTAPVTPPAYTPSIQFLATMEPTNTFLMKHEFEVTSDSVLECDMPATTPLPPTDNGVADFDIDSPLGEYVVDFLMKNVDVAYSLLLLVPSCFAIFDLEPLSLSFNFVFTSEIFKSLSFCLDHLCRLAILCLNQHAHTLHHLESLITISLDRLDILKEDLFVYEHVVMNLTSAGMRHHHLHLYIYPEIKQLAIKRVDEYGFVIRPDLIQRISLTGFLAQIIRSSNADALDLPYLLVLITGASQSRQHVDTSLIHIESYKSPTKSLFDAGSSRISIFTVNT
ncbi:hypothetical protein Tco_0702026 [Tanacetum coccineum]|uniref:Uncharacterized protein n=1 Tax=Tanacetum coccineum TaxID=301880 RepID=A0ABQ4XVW2_9ASTR